MQLIELIQQKIETVRNAGHGEITLALGAHILELGLGGGRGHAWRPSEILEVWAEDAQIGVVGRV